MILTMCRAGNRKALFCCPFCVLFRCERAERLLSQKMALIESSFFQISPELFIQKAANEDRIGTGKIRRDRPYN